MTNLSLAQSYFAKAKVRASILKVLHDGKGYSDVIREAQEIVELCLKGILRFVGIEPPKWHDVGPIVLQYRLKIVSLDQATADKLAAISARLREEREVSFYGDINFIPTEEYSESDSLTAMQDAEFVLSFAASVIH